MTPYFSDAGIEIFCGDSLELLREMPAESVQCCITSPPYWGLRDYGIRPSIWGGAVDCQHDFECESIATEIGRGNWAQGMNGRGEVQPGGRDAAAETVIRSSQERGFCSKCGAWLGCLGLEPTPQLFVTHMVTLFAEVRRVLAPDGTVWLNLGDSYAASSGYSKQGQDGEMADRACAAPGGPRERKLPGYRGDRGAWEGKHAGRLKQNGLDTSYGAAMGPETQPNRLPIDGLKPKDLIGIPWRVAFALQADGWYLRSEIIWHKPNPMPESVQDRPTRAHEHLFLLSKSERYFYNAAAIAEPLSPDTHARYARGRSNNHKWADGGPGKQTIATNKPGSLFAPQELAACENGTALLPIGRAPGVNPKCAEPGSGVRANSDFSAAISRRDIEARNKRTVWTIPTQPFPEAHFATFPEDLVAPCIFAGTKRGDLVLDPFSGAATVAVVAKRNGCRYVGLELNPEYCEIAARRLRQSVFDFGEISS